MFASFLGGMCRFTLGFSVWEDCWAWIGAGAGSCAASPVFNGHGQSGSLVCAFRLIEWPWFGCEKQDGYLPLDPKSHGIMECAKFSRNKGAV